MLISYGYHSNAFKKTRVSHPDHPGFLSPMHELNYIRKVLFGRPLSHLLTNQKRRTLHIHEMFTFHSRIHLLIRSEILIFYLGMAQT